MFYTDVEQSVAGTARKSHGLTFFFFFGFFVFFFKPTWLCSAARHVRSLWLEHQSAWPGLGGEMIKGRGCQLLPANSGAAPWGIPGPGKELAHPRGRDPCRPWPAELVALRCLHGVLGSWSCGSLLAPAIRTCCPMSGTALAHCAGGWWPWTCVCKVSPEFHFYTKMYELQCLGNCGCLL